MAGHDQALASSSARPGRRSRRGTAWLVSIALVVLVVAAILAITWGSSSRRSALRTIPPERHQALLSHEVDELREFCGEGRPQALDEHCREVAKFAAQFDECTGECNALVRRELSTAPTR